MSSELLEFTGRDDFDFLKFAAGNSLTKDEISSFKADCMRVNTTVNRMAIDQCRLGLELVELKNGGAWKDVINPETGLAFFNYSFGDFCKYVFHQPSTRTSELIRIAQFATESETGEVFFIDEKYKEFNTSQLVELASVPSEYRVYFSADMSVAEMRVAKDYVKNSAGFLVEKKKVGFDLLTKAQEWKENGRKTLPVANELEGQTSLFEEKSEDETEDGASLRNRTSDFSEVGEEGKTDDCEEIASMSDEYEPDEGEIWQGGGIDRADEDQDDQSEGEGDIDAEWQEEQEDLRTEMQTIEEAAEQSVLPGYGFTTRDEIRFFLEDYKNWHRRDDILTPFTKHCYWYTLKTFDIVYAFEVQGISNEALNCELEEIDEAGPIYFLYRSKFGPSSPVVMVGKRQLENYLMAKREEMARRF